MSEIRDQLQVMGFLLVRQDGGHLVYRHPNGGQLVAAASPSDYRAYANTLAEARRLAGVSKQGQEARAGERRKRRRGQPPAAIDPRAAGPAIPMVAKPAQVPLPRPVADAVEEPEAPSVRNVPVVIKNLGDYEPKPKPLPKVPVAHIRAVDALPKGMRDRVLKLAKGDYSKIKILADNRVEVSQ